MHVHFLDPYRQRASLIHRLDARVKLVLALAFILTNSLLPVGAWPAYLLMLALVLSAAVLADLGLGFALKRSALALPFVLAALPLLFTVDGPALFSLPLGFATLTATAPGLERFASLALKSWVSVQAAVLLAAVTPFPELLGAMRALRVPKLLVAIIGLMWRYLFVLVDEAMRLMRARQARSSVSDLPGLHPGGTLAWRARTTGGMAGSLFVRSMDRSDRIYTAMVSRGYDGEVRALKLPRVGRAQWIAAAALIAWFALLLALSYLL